MCTEILMEYYEDAPECENQAINYVKCVKELSCNDLIPVFESEGEEVPAACESKFNELMTCWGDDWGDWYDDWGDDWGDDGGDDWGD